MASSLEQEEQNQNTVNCCLQYVHDNLNQIGKCTLDYPVNRTNDERSTCPDMDVLYGGTYYLIKDAPLKGCCIKRPSIKTQSSKNPKQLECTEDTPSDCETKKGWWFTAAHGGYTIPLSKGNGWSKLNGSPCKGGGDCCSGACEWQESRGGECVSVKPGTGRPNRTSNPALKPGTGTGPPVSSNPALKPGHLGRYL